ncbi:SDR family NAD(P)-dependent oxidoreductase [Acinetobacter sp. MD2(2019)]|uniref:SDR family NAD(P)-dependent oxidoreductase n=1 Tax=Acinetobacter sp. MD2(2019) TaxID=2605273 RepID=UPI002D1E8874|nr:SDR family NAD(P)-dependent oxidoreductase [Acinetobacter sp. MD2(2019)]MEB3754451.1 SDR family NAD(P)-dependent oxidoreductase [Acinetobacter sp. MD2(2019)]
MLALVTGASAGFGVAICKSLIQQGYRVIGAARRLDKLQQLQAELGADFFPLVLDVSADHHTLEACLKQLPADFGLDQIMVLVNNAGLALGLDAADQANLDDWNTMIDTNTKGLINMTRLVLPYMVKRQTGLIINLGSIAGTYPYPGGNVYGATKAFVAQFSLNLRADLAGTGVRVTNIEPGLCGGTEFSVVRFHGDAEKAEQLYQNTQPLVAEDIANTVAWVVSQPPHININRIEIMPTSQSFNPLKVTPIA